MRSSGIVKTSKEGANSKGSHSSLLGMLLFGFCDKFADVFNWRAVIKVESVALALRSCLVGKDPSISCESAVRHVDTIIQLHDFLYCLTVLKLSHCFFLRWGECTSTARMTDEGVMSPTAHSPFLTASIAYYTWKRWQLGEKMVMAVSYIQIIFKL